MRHTTLLFLLLAGALSVALFSVKYQVQDLEEELIDLNKTIIGERQAIHVLQAEWSHLNNPERLGKLAERHLGMKPASPSQLASFKDVERLQLPVDPEGEIPADLSIPAVSSTGQKSQ